MTAAVQTAQLGNTNPAWRNRIINGDMRIDQRNDGASVTIGSAGNLVYTLDRWAAYCDQNSKFSVQKATTAPTGFSYALLATSLSAYSVGASDAFGLQQSIEGYNIADLGWGTSSAQTVTLSFKVISSLTGTFGGALRNSANNRSYPFSYSIPVANTWTTVSITVAGDTTGTWLTTNSAGIRIWFSLGAGSTYSGTANAWAGANYLQPTGSVSVVGTNGATFYITGVQLEKGSTATSFDYRPYGTELALCQRYYEKGSAGAGTRSGDNIAYTYINYKQEKRALPTFAGVSQTLNANYTDSVQCYQTGLGSGNNSLFTWTSSAEL